ncbi:TrmB family transcriptional regulator [Pendulispora albinea]|uniref:Transcription regulator TrmB N-terminal domain-containing protein n=1 Tax=Pendulispora albinea TaxID=2741071 RepID=A0ABZ2LV90_9BACT
MRWSKLALLDEAGFSLYEKRALVTLGILGVADAASLCRQGEIPTSKIYLAMEKLGRLGLCEVQKTRPKLYSALPPELVVDRLVELARERAEDFAQRSTQLREALSELPGRLRGRQTFVDLALGTESHVKRHLSRLATARTRVLSYLEEGDLASMDRVAKDGFDLWKRLSRAQTGRKFEHRVVFGFSDRTAPALLAFLRAYGPSMAHLSGIRYSGELGHPFHVIDDDTVILSLDHPFVPEGRFASLLVRDAALAESLAHGFDALWQKALRDLREVRFYPRRRSSPGP